MPSSVLIGFAAGFSLIIAIGVQNVFVLRQGVRREHVGAVVAVCAASDALLIAAGIAGLGALVAGNQGALAVIKWLGAAVLIGYGLLALRRALRASEGLVAGVEEATTSTITAVVTTCLALTWLNPHVYLDTVVLLGALANQEGETGRWFFGFGAMLASVVWFVALGYGARLLSGFMSRPSSWRILDALVAALMLTLGGLLLVR